MNQILVTKKLYITPELKRKKKIYKFYFFLSIFLVFALVSAYIYAEVDRTKSEETSQAILEEFNQGIDNTTANEDVLIAVLNADPDDETDANTEYALNQSQKTANRNKVYTTNNGYNYSTIATINIPKINVNYPILDGQTDSVEETEYLLKISPIKFWGANPNEVGNFCIVGHNYRDTRFFSKVLALENGDIVEITDDTGRTLKYSVYDKYEVSPDDTSCTSQLTDGRKEITLITCTNDSKLRVIVKAKEV